MVVLNERRWAFGVTMWELLEDGKRPYSSMSNTVSANAECNPHQLQFHMFPWTITDKLCFGTTNWTAYHSFVTGLEMT